MKTLINKYKSLLQYYSDNKPKIIETNLNRLIQANCFAFLVTIFFFLVTPYIVKGWSITLEYWLLLPTYVFFLVAGLIIKKRNFYKVNLIQSLSACYCILMLVNFILISSRTYTEDPETFVSVWLIVIPIIFVLNPLVDNLISIVGGVVFIIIVFARKDTVSIEHDVFSTILAVAVSRFTFVMTNQLRASEARERNLLYNLSITDKLTGLYNKMSFEELCREFMNGRTASGKQAFCIIDIDDFKHVNDTYGHHAGDEVIKLISSCLRSDIEPEDMVGRIGGDEFAVMLRTEKSISNIEKLFKSFNDDITSSTTKLLGEAITISAGVVMLPIGSYEYVKMYKLADAELYKVKNNGKNNFGVIDYSESINE